MATVNAAQRLAAAAVLFLLAAVAALPSAAQTFDEAVAAYASGDYATAYRGFRHLAEQGDAFAQDYLGFMYRHGEGIPQDHAEAVRWYRRAAEQGNANAQYNLALMYGKGEGVPQDYAEAVRWYRRAAEQGIGRAQNNLAVMYEYGQGIPQNYVLAHMWYNIAAARMPAEEADERNKAKKNRDRVAQLLSRDELARAQRLAREWQPGAGTEPLPSAPPADDGDMRDRIVTIQHSLVLLGYASGPADGVIGPKTRLAIRAFQAAAGLPVDGRLSGGLESALLSVLRNVAAAPAPAPARRALELASTGSGFRVSADGHLLTNAHVVQGCVEVRVPPTGVVAVAARDEASDLALLDGPAGAAVAAFRQGRGIRPGAGAVVIGYPLRGALASGPQVTAGNVSALAGPGDDRRLIQITAPVQPGNSGGPVLDSSGNAVGVVVSKLDAMAMARATGDIPQNVNFAVSAGAARAFLDSEGVAYETAPSDEARAPDDIAAAARGFTVLVECWN